MTHDFEILIVEDSPTQAERLKELLDRSGYNVRLAPDGKSALAAVRERPPALVITDVVMPEMDGYTLCSEIKSDPTLREVPVILVTSLSEPEDVIRSLQCGADNFIRKPFDEHYLLSRISNMLSSRALRAGGRISIGLEVYLGGERHFINAERQQILDFLLATYEEVGQVNAELATKNAELEDRQKELERTLRSLDDERARVRELADLKRAVLEATAEGIVLVDLDGNAVLRNDAFRRIVSRLPELRLEGTLADSAGAMADVVTDPDGLRTFIDALAADPELEASHDVELRKSRGSLHVFTAPVRAESDRLIGRIFVLRDTTAERQVERLKSELVATVSHELRTPLTGLLGFAELLAARDYDEETRQSHLETIASEARRLTELVNDFLDLHRIEEGSFTLNRDIADLGEVLHMQVKSFSHQSPSHSVTLDLPEQALSVRGDRDRLAQVVANLLSNAIKYSPGGGHVEVRASRAGDLVEVAVRDHGIGIPADQHERIFTKFFRVDSTDTRRIGGTGLGLALCREIVQAHGGEIGFESVEDKGSTFWFRLPAAEARVADDARTDADSRPARVA